VLQSLPILWFASSQTVVEELPLLHTSLQKSSSSPPKP
jgi:hypothetical protein